MKKAGLVEIFLTCENINSIFVKTRSDGGGTE